MTTQLTLNIFNRRINKNPVVPAQAWTQSVQVLENAKDWIPACAGNDELLRSIECMDNLAAIFGAVRTNLKVDLEVRAVKAA